MMKLLVTTNPGMEDICVDDISEILKMKPKSANVLSRGRVIVEYGKNISLDTICKVVENVRSAHKISMVLNESIIDISKKGLNKIYEITYLTKIGFYTNPKTSFAIRAERIGKHEFTSLDVAKVAGQAIVDLTKRLFGERAPVDLKHPAVIYDALVINKKYIFALRISGDDSLHKRRYRVYEHPAALKPTLAYGMLKIAKLEKHEILLDPMCGGGTIAIEAALNFAPKKIICMDISPKHLRGAIANALASIVYKKISFILGDAKELDKHVGEQVDVVVTNPPYGIRLFRHKLVKELYSKFLKSCKRVLSERGRMVIITSEYELFKKLALDHGYFVVASRKVFHGNLEAEIIMVKPLK